MAATKERNRSLNMETEDIANKAIIVTGGTTGIGRATAILLAAHDARLFIFGRHEEELNDAMTAVRELTENVYGAAADAANPDSIARIFSQAKQQLGQIDALVNNAALAAGSVVDTDYAEMEYIVKTNLLGYMNCTHEAIKIMKKQGHGHIVNVGSMSADVREEGSSIYVATKSGIQGFSAALRKEVNKLGIKVSLIEPGSVGTDMQPESPAEQRQKQESEEMLKAEDIAACIYYCLVQPRRCDVINVQIRPHMQSI